MSDKDRDASKDFTTLDAAGNNVSLARHLVRRHDHVGCLTGQTTSSTPTGCPTRTRDSGKDFDHARAGRATKTPVPASGPTARPCGLPTFLHDAKVYTYNMPPSSDATLSGLTVSPRDIIGFAADRTSYEVGVASTETRATVVATANHSAASVAYSPADADTTSTTIHDVDLSAGRNSVTITVTAEDGSTTETYTVSVNRGVTDDYGWKAVDDLDGLIAAGNLDSVRHLVRRQRPYVGDRLDNSDHKIYAYNTDGTRDSGKDFNTLNAAGNGFRPEASGPTAPPCGWPTMSPPKFTPTT